MLFHRHAAIILGFIAAITKRKNYKYEADGLKSNPAIAGTYDTEASLLKCCLRFDKIIPYAPAARAARRSYVMKTRA